MNNEHYLIINTKDNTSKVSFDNETAMFEFRERLKLTGNIVIEEWRNGQPHIRFIGTSPGESWCEINVRYRSNFNLEKDKSYFPRWVKG